ncbi:3-deoxy-7-phosphoheptulonate synthase [Xenorhabdus hominickii]|uniref:Phospho-2-dehydro-3-deoxyheptonate aldolase n=1 Tax=Xenorhabdus hominickii TaxID=351679 RepID=A0A2G0Q9U4_XENHO|nr:3-deoxy-7-phosphoheptulonate synthase [Xenorhabdus hominickii]AOM41017.1 3-deoxy-D-arabinose-heptulosonic-7-phosphate synthase [Xenorhabdus hominickii]PHM56005.1 phenazine biosynthesis protein PhzC [Xenorhabdus hominickii]
MKKIETINSPWQQPTWENLEVLHAIKKELLNFPPLINHQNLTHLYGQLEKVWLNKAVIIQMGDCAERIIECDKQSVAPKIDFLHDLSEIFSTLLNKTVITVGRIAGQYAKPRSNGFEKYQNITLPVWRGDCINSPEPVLDARINDPKRMLSSYHAASQTLSTIDDYIQSRPDMNLQVWTSHEALLLDYEYSQLRTTSNGQKYLASTHWPWIGMRTLDLNSPHVEMLSNIDNPIACKISDKVSPNLITGLCQKLNPHKIPGRLTFITRFGYKHIHKLSPLIDSVLETGIPVLWMCDPMHGNTTKTKNGNKQRVFEEMVNEVTSFQTQLAKRHACCAGIHLETTAEDIAECFGCGFSPNESELSNIICDPRLNKIQAIELIKQWTINQETL